MYIFLAIQYPERTRHRFWWVLILSRVTVYQCTSAHYCDEIFTPLCDKNP